MISLSPHKAQYLAYKLTNRQPPESVEKLANTMQVAQAVNDPEKVKRGWKFWAERKKKTEPSCIFSPRIRDLRYYSNGAE